MYKTHAVFHTILFSPFNHYNMIPKFCLNWRVCKHRLIQHTYRQGECCFLKWSHHGPSGHPTQVAPLPGFIFTILCSHFIEFHSRLQLFHGFQDFSMFFTQNVSDLYCIATTFGALRLFVSTVTPRGYFSTYAEESSNSLTSHFWSSIPNVHAFYSKLPVPRGTRWNCATQNQWFSLWLNFLSFQAFSCLIPTTQAL